MWEVELDEPEGLIAGPSGVEPSVGILVLSGSSGRVERDRVRLLAKCGVVALSFRWFGAVGQPPGICEVPLELFRPAIDRLATYAESLAVLGVSKGAEAALLLGTRDPRLSVVIACAPSSVVWANLGAGVDGTSRPLRSSWTTDGAALAFVPYDEPFVIPTVAGLPTYRALYERSLDTFAELVPGASIPVERIGGDVIVAAGGDDMVWPSVRFAHEIADRRAEHGLATTVLTEAGAGHRIVFPGEAPILGGAAMARGGTPSSDAALGQKVWAAMRRVLSIG